MIDIIKCAWFAANLLDSIFNVLFFVFMLVLITNFNFNLINNTYFYVLLMCYLVPVLILTFIITIVILRLFIRVIIVILNHY